MNEGRGDSDSMVERQHFFCFSRYNLDNLPKVQKQKASWGYQDQSTNQVLSFFFKTFPQWGFECYERIQQCTLDIQDQACVLNRVCAMIFKSGKRGKSGD